MIQARCPYCQSVFNVHDDQLKAKSGMVRCGACLQAFRADLNLVPAAVVVGKDKTAHDESWAEELLKETELSSNKPVFATHSDHDVHHHDHGNNIKISLGASELSDFMLHEGSHEQTSSPGESTPSFDLEPSLMEAQANPDELWAQELLEELAQSQSEPAPAIIPNQKLPEQKPVTETPGSAFLFGDEHALDFLNDDDLNIQSSAQRTENFSLPQDDLSDPVSLVTKKNPMPWNKILLWGGVNLAAVLLLFGQVLFYEAESFQNVPFLNQIVKQFCQRLHCRTEEDSNFLRVDMLIVRPDPDHGRLLVDTLIHNISMVEHPFPDLRLSMKDPAGTLIGTRLIHPAEYLGPAVTQLVQFEPDTPVHISLQVADPGKTVASTSLQWAP